MLMVAFAGTKIECVDSVEFTIQPGEVVDDNVTELAEEHELASDTVIEYIPAPRPEMPGVVLPVDHKYE